MKKVIRLFGMTICIIAFALFAIASGSNDKTAEKVGEVATPTAAANADIETKDEPTPSAPDTDPKSGDSGSDTLKDAYYVGDTIVYDDVSVTVLKSGVYTSDNEFMQPAEGKEIIFLEVYAKNDGKSDAVVSYFDFKCYADGYECDSKYRDNVLSATLSAGRTAQGFVYFEVPQDSKEIEIEYDLGVFTNKKATIKYEGDKDSGIRIENTAERSAGAFKVGDIIETSSLRISYLGTGTYESESAWFGAPDGFEYLYIELEVENISSSDKSISSFSFEGYADGVSCDAYFGQDDDLSATLSAGRKTKGKITFTVPKDAKIVEFEYDDSILSDKKVIFTVR